MRVLRLKPGRKVTHLGSLSTQVGWKHEETIKTLEAKRKVKATSYYARKKAILKLKDNDAKKRQGINMNNVKRFLKYFLVFGPMYVAYMIWVDIPMYYNRWRQDEMNNHQYYSVYEGISHAASCKVITGKYEAWAEDFSWMLGYFSFAVWTSIWLIHGVSS